MRDNVLMGKDFRSNPRQKICNHFSRMFLNYLVLDKNNRSDTCHNTIIFLNSNILKIGNNKKKLVSNNCFFVLDQVEKKKKKSIAL